MAETMGHGEQAIAAVKAQAEADALHRPGPRWVPGLSRPSCRARTARAWLPVKDPASMGGSPRGAGQQ